MNELEDEALDGVTGGRIILVDPVNCPNCHKKIDYNGHTIAGMSHVCDECYEKLKAEG